MAETVRSVGGAGVQFSGSAGRFRVRISGAHALRLISRTGRGFDGVMYNLANIELSDAQ